MAGYSYSVPVPQSSPNIAPAATSGGYAYTSPVTQQILQTEPEKLASGYVAFGAANAEAAAPASMSAYIPYQSGDGDEIASVYMAFEGEDKSGDARAAAVVQQAKLLELSTQHGEGPLWEKADPKHRVGELLIAAWEIYLAHPGSGPIKVGPAKHKSDFFQWLDAIPEWDRVVMLSNKIRQMGTSVLGTPAQRKILAAEAPKLAAPGVKNELNLRPSVVKAFVRGVKYLDAASRPSYAVSFSGDRATYRGAAFDTGMMQTVFSGPGFAIWVMGGDGTLYAGKHVYGQMHHSSFISGGSILSGGEIRARSGKIEFISGKSGHYCPPIESLVEALKRLRTFGINMSELRVLVWRADSQDPFAAVLTSGDDVIRNAVNKYKSWGHLKLAQKASLQAGRYNEFS